MKPLVMFHCAITVQRCLEQTQKSVGKTRHPKDFVLRLALWYFQAHKQLDSEYPIGRSQIVTFSPEA